MPTAAVRPTPLLLVSLVAAAGLRVDFECPEQLRASAVRADRDFAKGKSVQLEDALTIRLLLTGDRAEVDTAAGEWCGSDPSPLAVDWDNSSDNSIAWVSALNGSAPKFQCLTSGLQCEETLGPVLPEGCPGPLGLGFRLQPVPYRPQSAAPLVFNLSLQGASSVTGNTTCSMAILPDPDTSEGLPASTAGSVLRARGWTRAA
eukprot:TRINITY_DN26865_c0_g1_i1.p1 TRINITY_DN26865_c0_g1~~TRINITY_DN26865_c0_g1_i1.p1  ORF type:complete len:203 (+),score=18.11 TRINITY_DN26865_c0_g1_i1:77-685(+)